ncbi:MAG: 2-oxoacid:ferredoxin oxidoreductase subunit beta [Fidelibacterota bacterium]
MEQNYTPKDYKSALKSIWCPGCGDFGVLSAVYQALARLQLDPWDVSIISGIGCSSRLPGYVTTYGFNAIHGRVIPIATGVKLANPDIVVLGVGGDGDGLSIGGGHFPHVARRNVDITYIIMDNQVYGLTKGQVSPTTEVGELSKTTIYGNIDPPLKPVSLALAYRVSFVARGFSSYHKHLAELIANGIQHKGFAFIHALSPCPTFRGKEQFEIIKEKSDFLPEDYDYTDKQAAYRIAEDRERLWLGLIYKKERPTYMDRLKGLKDRAKKTGTYRIREMIDHFVP